MQFAWRATISCSHGQSPHAAHLRCWLAGDLAPGQRHGALYCAAARPAYAPVCRGRQGGELGLELGAMEHAGLEKGGTNKGPALSLFRF
uniref:Uncharacterized protein n=1 Tax=Arundo donax TaxID=35708 RepID=A0A0A8XTQ0_ARUDO